MKPVTNPVNPGTNQSGWRNIGNYFTKIRKLALKALKYVKVVYQKNQRKIAIGKDVVNLTKVTSLDPKGVVSKTNDLYNAIKTGNAGKIASEASNVTDQVLSELSTLCTIASAGLDILTKDGITLPVFAQMAHKGATIYQLQEKLRVASELIEKIKANPNDTTWIRKKEFRQKFDLVFGEGEAQKIIDALKSANTKKIKRLLKNLTSKLEDKKLSFWLSLFFDIAVFTSLVVSLYLKSYVTIPLIISGVTGAVTAGQMVYDYGKAEISYDEKIDKRPFFKRLKAKAAKDFQTQVLDRLAALGNRIKETFGRKEVWITITDGPDPLYEPLLA